MKCEAQDRLSPLTSGSIPFLTMPASLDDPTGSGLEKFVDNEMEAQVHPMQPVGKYYRSTTTLIEY